MHPICINIIIFLYVMFIPYSLVFLERRLSELQHYPKPESEHEFNYVKFQISVAQGVKKMYEEYRNNKWCQLQEEATYILQVTNTSK